VRTPTDEQERILKNEENARIRLVKSAPGSGKTWLIAEEIRRKLAGWKDAQCGIAALSFTNVASDEIATALGHTPHHPHFVGTLDAFVYRYITRPFAKLFDPTLPLLELLPAEIANRLGESQRWTNSSLNIQLGAERWQTDNVFRISFVREENGKPILRGKPEIWKAAVELNVATSEHVLACKQAIWKSGRVSHSDAAFMAAEILRRNGDFVRGLLLKRFPTLVVDELQDTGWYLGQVLLQLLKDPRGNALVVGDPDQAIYEFNGAKPKLFSDFENIDGVKVHDLKKSQRCPMKVCAVAKLLTSSARDLESAKGNNGRTTLSVYGSIEHVRELWQAIQKRSPNSKHVVVTRKNTTAAAIRGQSSKKLPAFGSPPIQSLHVAVLALRRGDMKAAFAGAQATLARTLMATDAPESTAFGPGKLSRVEWRLTVTNLLFEAHKEQAGETIQAWGSRMKDVILKILSACPYAGMALEGKGSLKVPSKKFANVSRSESLSENTAGVPVGHLLDVDTVHAIKGQTHQTTILFVPHAPNAPECISAVWWSNNPDEGEERRVAYVATTRAEEWFILCVDADCAARLRNAQPAFHALFEERTVNELIAELAGNNGAA
jgi:DNA helicase-2/ATP-dependent DNA helicase PcrA